MVHVIENTDLINEVFNYSHILVGTSIMNSLGNGFQHKVAINFPDVEDKCKTATKYGDQRKLGTATVIEGNPTFILCYITKGRFRPDLKDDTLDYDALRNCLRLIHKNYKGERIASTIMGAPKYEGNGDKEKILSIFEETFSDCDVWLYDYEQTDRVADRNKAWQRVKEHIGKPDYFEEKKKFFWEQAFGIYKPIPEGYSLKEIKEEIEKFKKERENIGSFKK